MEWACCNRKKTQPAKQWILYLFVAILLAFWLVFDLNYTENGVTVLKRK